MATLTKVILMIFIIILGISISSNNFIHQLIVVHILHHQRLATKMLRPLGIFIAISSVIFITPYEHVAILIYLLIMMVCIFYYIRSHKSGRRPKISPREKAIQMYQMEIKEKRQQLERLKATLEKQKREKAMQDARTEKSD